MSNHTEFGHAKDALYTLHTGNAAEVEYELDEPIHSAYLLGLFNANGDGLALEGTRRELLDYLKLVTAYVERETDPLVELDQALKRLDTLRAERGDALDTARLADVARLDEHEVTLLVDVADAAARVNDEI
jgi:hypothetical protein